jgi:inner membrane protein
LDPLSQGVLGAAAAHASSNKHGAMACFLGLVGGMAADLDVLIRSKSDPILFLEYHRQFTHSLIFIPVGGFVCAVIVYFLFASRRLSFGRTYAYCTVGYATHGLLDACTSYGTQLLWPFSDARIAWHSISIIDPMFTLPILALVIVATSRPSPLWGRLALGWAIAYISFGGLQRHRAELVAHELAVSRGHLPAVTEAKPSFGNLVLWKTIYEHDGQYFIDAVRMGLDTSISTGESVAKLDLEADFPWLDGGSQQALDVERFRWFSAGHLSKSRDDDNMIVDMRYSMLPNQGDGLWGIVLSPDAKADEHVGYQMQRDMSAATRRKFFGMLFDRPIN